MATLENLIYFPLSNAYLCQDCNSVGNQAVQCPACASEALLSLAGILNRVEEVDLWGSRLTVEMVNNPMFGA